MQEQIQKEIQEKKLKIIDLQNTINELYSDTNIIPPQRERYDQFDKRCPRECGRFDGGNRSCRNRCDHNWYMSYDQNVEKRNLAIKRNITPLNNSKSQLEKEIEQLELKSTLPYLRNELLSSVSQFQTLEKTDPQFRQKQKDLKKSIFEQSAKVDELENQFNWFGNIPSMKPEIITPDPIVTTTTQLGAINTRPLIIGGIVGLVGLFLIWRFK